MKFDKKEDLIEWVSSHEVFTTALLVKSGGYIFILGSWFGCKCDYFVPCTSEGLDTENKMISGIPVRGEEFFRENHKKALNITSEVFTAEEEEYFQKEVELYVCDIHELKDIKTFPPAYLCDLHEWFTLAPESYRGYEFDEVDAGKNVLSLKFDIENLGVGCFSGSTGVIGCPTELLFKLVRAGIGKEMKLIPIGSKKKGFGEKEANVIGKRSVNRKYDDFLLPHHSLHIYRNRLTVSVDGGVEQEYMENFYWKRFYNNVDELAVCMLLYHHGIALNAQFTKGLYDIFMEKFKEKRD